MKSFALPALTFIGTTLALPTALDDPIRVLPWNWGFEIVSLDGPNCGPLGDQMASLVTRTTYGSNTVDGSEIYNWHIAYPFIDAKVAAGETKTLSCEATIQYKEYSNNMQSEASNYRLQLHKNGTSVAALYDLDEGVQAKWEFTYSYADKKIVDGVALQGPFEYAKYNHVFFSEVDSSFKQQIPLTKCGAGMFKFKTALTLTSKGTGSGSVSSEHITRNGLDGLYGLESGFSYDWSKCE